MMHRRPLNAQFRILRQACRMLDGDITDRLAPTTARSGCIEKKRETKLEEVRGIAARVQSL